MIILLCFVLILLFLSQKDYASTRHAGNASYV